MWQRNPNNNRYWYWQGTGSGRYGTPVPVWELRTTEGNAGSVPSQVITKMGFPATHSVTFHGSWSDSAWPVKNLIVKTRFLWFCLFSNRNICWLSTNICTQRLGTRQHCRKMTTWPWFQTKKLLLVAFWQNLLWLLNKDTEALTLLKNNFLPLKL